ncbi:hypothetical protein, partial [Streptomyces luteocolor]|uniref:hypothetical protein n=1 Tax=Streptomyces luteocolor TaxID=285500 RepID=UPI001EDC3069
RGQRRKASLALSPDCLRSPDIRSVLPCLRKRLLPVVLPKRSVNRPVSACALFLIVRPMLMAVLCSSLDGPRA